MEKNRFYCWQEKLGPTEKLHKMRSVFIIPFYTSPFGLQGIMQEPAKSSDLTIPDLFLYRYLQDRVCINRIENSEHLKT